MSNVRGSVDVWICHGRHVLWVLLANIGCGDGVVGNVFESRRILLENMVLLPFLLVLLLGCDESVTLVCLQSGQLHLIATPVDVGKLTFSILRVFVDPLAGSMDALVA